jgi:hypothetical protein
MHRCRWARGFPFVWGTVIFGPFHVETKLPVFLLFTVVVGTVYLLIYLHVRCVSPSAARRVTTYVPTLCIISPSRLWW